MKFTRILLLLPHTPLQPTLPTTLPQPLPTKNSNVVSKKKSNVVEHLKFLISSKIKKSNVLKHLKKNTKCFKTFEKITKCYTTFDFFFDTTFEFLSSLTVSWTAATVDAIQTPPIPLIY